MIVSLRMSCVRMGLLRWFLKPKARIFRGLGWDCARMAVQNLLQQWVWMLRCMDAVWNWTWLGSTAPDWTADLGMAVLPKTRLASWNSFQARSGKARGKVLSKWPNGCKIANIHAFQRCLLNQFPEAVLFFPPVSHMCHRSARQALYGVDVSNLSWNFGLSVQMFLACGWYGALGRVVNFEMCHLRSLGRVANFENGFPKWGYRIWFFGVFNMLHILSYDHQGGGDGGVY